MLPVVAEWTWNRSHLKPLVGKAMVSIASAPMDIIFVGGGAIPCVNRHDGRRLTCCSYCHVAVKTYTSCERVLLTIGAKLSVYGMELT